MATQDQLPCTDRASPARRQPRVVNPLRGEQKMTGHQYLNYTAWIGAFPSPGHQDSPTAFSFGLH